MDFRLLPASVFFFFFSEEKKEWEERFIRAFPTFAADCPFDWALRCLTIFVRFVRAVDFWVGTPSSIAASVLYSASLGFLARPPLSFLALLFRFRRWAVLVLASVNSFSPIFHATTFAIPASAFPCFVESLDDGSCCFLRLLRLLGRTELSGNDSTTSVELREELSLDWTHRSFGVRALRL